MIPYEWMPTVTSIVWLGFIGYLLWVMRITWKDARKRRDEKKSREALELDIVE